MTMNSYPYRILLAAGLALLVSAVAAQAGDTPYSSTGKNAPQAAATQTPSPPAQTTGHAASQTSRLPAVKGTADSAAAEPSQQPTDKMSGQSIAQPQGSSKLAAKTPEPKSAKPAHHAAKKASRPDQTATPGEKAFRQALRQCVKQQDQTQRDSCLDSAIEQRSS
jgi:hypothetical protein